MKFSPQPSLVCLIYRLKAGLYESHCEKAGCHGSRDNLARGGQSKAIAPSNPAPATNRRNQRRIFKPVSCHAMEVLLAAHFRPTSLTQGKTVFRRVKLVSYNWGKFLYNWVLCHPDTIARNRLKFSLTRRATIYTGFLIYKTAPPDVCSYEPGQQWYTLIATALALPPR